MSSLIKQMDIIIIASQFSETEPNLCCSILAEKLQDGFTKFS